ncbi:hypothetical protein L195_g009835 [Trifolium pratense]|uniref:Uncharacterized protein n=1 Tax=Trifolium pratense TaxID=57577 RepID=A0A2K3PD14_TRIPR|nr:hypothetical protein L195_g009835 [Trifolium pratense]
MAHKAQQRVKKSSVMGNAVGPTLFGMRRRHVSVPKKRYGTVLLHAIRLSFGDWVISSTLDCPFSCALYVPAVILGFGSGTPTFNSVKCGAKVFRVKIVKLAKVVYIALSAGPKSFDDVNGHQVAARKGPESHDEQLMFIIPVVGRYNTQTYCDH